jgi:hypothetical protein
MNPGLADRLRKMEFILKPVLVPTRKMNTSKVEVKEITFHNYHKIYALKGS